MIGGRSALLSAASGPGYGNWTGNYEDVSLLLRGGVPALVPIDESPVPKDVEVVGSPRINTTLFKYGDSALDFPGASGVYYSILGLNNFTPGLGAWTVEAWIYPKSTADWVIMSGSNFYITRFGTSTYVGDRSVNRIEVASVPAVYEWTHVAAVRESNGTIRLFFNGIQQASSTGSLSTATTTGILIGGRTAGINIGTDALLDDVRVTVGVARYTSNFTRPAAELPANITDDPSYNSVSLLLRDGVPVNETPALIPLDESPTPKAITAAGNASVTTAVAKWNQGSGGSSLRLLGSPGVLSVPKLGLISTDFTIEFWIYLLDGGVANQVICTTYNAPTQLDTFIVFRSSPGNIISFTDPSGVGSASTALPLATWTHIACVYIHSTRNYRIFVNGIGSTSATGTAITAEAANFFIGGSPEDNNIGSFYLNACIDDFRVTKLARYTKNFLPPPAELPAI